MSTCNALVPVNAMDTQVLTTIQQINELTRQRAIASIKATTNSICITGALSILNVFGYCNTEIIIKSQKWQARDLDKERFFPDLQGRLAYDTPIFWFWGGPPTNLKWYKGTLQTLLDDRVLDEIHRQGAFKVASLIGIDFEGLAK